MHNAKSRHRDRDAQRLHDLEQPDRRQLQLASVLSAAGSAVWIAQAFVLSHAIGDLLGPAKYDVDLTAPTLIFLLLAGVRVLCEALSGYITAAASERVQLRVRDRLLEIVAHSSPFTGERPHSGEIAAIITHHVDALAPYLRRYGPSRMRVILVPMVVLLATLPVSWAIGLILGASGPLIPLFTALIGQRARAASERQLGAIGTMNGYLLDKLQGLVTLRVFDAVERAAAGLRRATTAIHRDTMAVLRLAFLSSAVLELFSALGVALVAVYVGFNLLGYFSFGTYGMPLTLTRGLFALLLAPEFFQPLRDFASAYHDRTAALAASREIGRVLEADWPTLIEHGAARATELRVGRPPSVKLEHVSLYFPRARHPALRDISVAVQPGEHVALIGSSGSGKSLVLGLMAGLIRPTEGRVEIGGAAPGETMSDCGRPRIAWVGQRPAFMRASVRTNLTLGRDGLDDEYLWHLATCFDADGVIGRLPRGFATMLGENGEGLSGGEAQRLALMRAALADADLILADEPDEHLDPETAAIVREGLLRIADGRTLIIATHDVRFASRMHRVVDLAELNAAGPYLEAAE